MDAEAATARRLANAEGLAMAIRGFDSRLAAAHVSPSIAADSPQPQRAFASAADAATALVTALRTHNEADLKAVLGPDADRVIDSGDRYADQELHNRFVALYDEKHAINQTVPGHAELDVGPNDWPLPIPIIEATDVEFRHESRCADDHRSAYRP